MKTKLELFGRSLLIYFTTILIGSFVSAIYLTGINFDSSGDFSAYFIAGMLITGAISIPTILILFIGFFLIYKKCKNNHQKWKALILIWLPTCYPPIIIAIILLFEPDTDGSGQTLLLASIPYALMSFISTFYFTYYFDKKKTPIFQQEKEIINDDILDAPF